MIFFFRGYSREMCGRIYSHGQLKLKKHLKKLHGSKDIWLNVRGDEISSLKDLTIFHLASTSLKKERAISSLIDVGESKALWKLFSRHADSPVIYTVYLVIRADETTWTSEERRYGARRFDKTTWNHAGTYSVTQTSCSSGYEAILHRVQSLLCRVYSTHRIMVRCVYTVWIKY